MSDFESIRQEILKLPDADRRRLAAWLQALGAAPQPQSSSYDSGSALYADVSRTLAAFGYSLEPWERFARLKPAFAGALRASAIHLDASIQRTFKGIGRAEHAALRSFLVDCARSRCRDENRALTLRSILDCLLPLEELLDNRFPEMRVSGQLSPVLLNYLHNQPVLDSAKEPRHVR